MRKVSDFKSRLQALLDKHRISQVDLAKNTGISQAAISRYLDGKRDARGNNIEKIAEYFNVPLGWLTGYDEKTGDNDISKSEQIVFDMLRQRPPLMALVECAKNLDDERLKKLCDLVCSISSMQNHLTTKNA